MADSQDMYLTNYESYEELLTARCKLLTVSLWKTIVSLFLFFPAWHKGFCYLVIMPGLQELGRDAASRYGPLGKGSKRYQQCIGNSK